MDVGIGGSGILGYSNNARHYWWLYERFRPDLYCALGRGEHFAKHPEGWEKWNSSFQQVIIAAQTGKYVSINLISNSIVFSHMIVVFVSDSRWLYALLNSYIHRVWVWKHSARMKRDIRYIPSDCFETFPFPEITKDSKEILNDLGEQLDSTRRKIMLERQKGLTSLYNAFHDPMETDEELAELRKIHRKIDTAVLEAYGWSDIKLNHGFHSVPYLPANANIRCTISEDARLEILDRLMELNRLCYSEESKLLY